MRIWAQLRAPVAQGAEHWGRSFYLDSTLRDVDLAFADFRPIGPVSSERPVLDRVHHLMLVIDTLNTLPGTKGTIEITDLWLAK
jgi:hypothetical protein